MSGWWLASSAASADLVDVGQRGREVVELEVALEAIGLLDPLVWSVGHAAYRGMPCASSPWSPPRPRCCSPSARATRSSASRTSATSRPRRSTSPKVTRDRLPPGLDAREIDEAVRAHTEPGEAIYELDADALRELQPDLIVTQALCAVCAVSADDVRAVAEQIESEPTVLSLDPMTLGEVLGDIRVARRRRSTARTPAWTLIDGLRGAHRRRPARGARRRRPRVAALEWLDPVFVAGHWVPQMIEYAGGVDLLAPARRALRGRHLGAGARRSSPRSSSSCRAATTPSARRRRPTPSATSSRSSAPTRSSPSTPPACSRRPSHRLVDGLETLAHILHPDRVPEPPSRPLEVAL